jgi:16S rRNA (uracil1498-N3)-methyltransferase
MRRFYAPPESFKEGCVTLSLEETRHLRDVLRLREGEEASVFDGLGHEYECRIDTISKKDSVLSIVREIPAASPESPLDLTIAAAILPGEKFEITVQKAVELGVRMLQPLYTIRCEVKPGGGRSKIERWEKIALESAKQSGRATLMKIAEPVGLKDFFLRPSSLNDERLIFFSERDGAGFAEIKAGKKITAVFGPKGGWDDLELEMAKKAGFAVITFGGRIMRAETAAIAMSAILQHHFGDLS